jgi:hypothetical protein
MFLSRAIAVAIFPAVKVKKYCRKIIIGDYFKTTVYHFPIFQNDLVQTPIDFREQPKHIRGPHKNVYASLRSSNRLLQS